MSKSSLSKERLADLCREIDEEIHSLVAAQAAGTISQLGFNEGLLDFLAQSAGGNGLILTTGATPDGWFSVSLKVSETSAPCAAFEYHPNNGEFRTVGSSFGCD